MTDDPTGHALAAREPFGDGSPGTGFTNPWVKRPTKRRILLVDDEFVVADSIRRLIAWLSPVSEVVVTASLAQTVAVLQSQPTFDLVLLDLALPDAADLQALQVVKSLEPSLQVVILSGSASPDLVTDCHGAGAHDVIRKSYEAEDLAKHVKRLLQSYGFLQPAPSVAPMAQEAVIIVNGKKLSPRLYSILELIATGYSNKMIAAKLSISAATVKNHVSRLFATLGVQRRGEAVALFRQQRGR